MHERAFGMPFRRARKRSATGVSLAAIASIALAVSVLHGAGVAAADDKPVSAWGKDSPDFEMPPVKVGENRPVASERSENPTDEALLPWQREQRERVKGPAGKAGGGKQAPSRAAAAGTSALSVVPEGQGNVPWHRYTSFAITDALTAKIDYSTGNLMLTATDFDIAGVGQRLQLARTYNSLDA
ncbi:DUF6531 domain-containing protein, partial [Streptomyces sp. AHA2]|uniref:DUF6531 domain-containing protein n=1 Tax=Streptomyces sp. AHA2 TaxID=3064526 RepID=UPI002FE38952